MNTSIYELARKVPDEAKKPITAGRLKGFTDINPMWRIKRLTELFGPCGLGWWYEITDKRLVEDEITKQKAAFLDILLYYKDPDTGEVSRGIPGTGGSSFVAQERNGAYMSDECFKMALTDAISVAAKSLGLGADVYYEKDRSKYSDPSEEPVKKEIRYLCADCGRELTPVKSGGRVISIQDWHDGTKKELGRPLCVECRRKLVSQRRDADAYAESYMHEDAGDRV